MPQKKVVQPTLIQKSKSMLGKYQNEILASSCNYDPKLVLTP